MGRLQRKKDPSKKKTKRRELSDATVRQTSSAAVEVRKKPVDFSKKAKALSKSSAVKQENSVLNKALQFLREVKIELKKVTWPSRKQTMGSTAVVIILVMIISLFLGLVDFSLSSLIRAVLQ